ncbi:MAG: prepilin peptidase [Patescibacteria group bacterium]
MNVLISFALALLGLAVGSFLTVVVARLGTGQTLFWGRSRCPHCSRELRWFELLPVLSFLLQGGQCRSCSHPISRSYLAIELVTAVLFVALGWGIGQGAVPLPASLAAASVAKEWELFVSFFYYAFFGGFAVAIAFYDFEHHLIPAVLIWPLLAAGLADKIAAWVRSGSPTLFLATIIAGLAAFAVFWSLWFFSRGRAMGRGDADLALAIAAYLGPPLAIAGFLLAFWIGAAFGILAVAMQKLRWKSELAFAPFLLIGALAAIFLAPQISSLLR